MNDYPWEGGIEMSEEAMRSLLESKDNGVLSMGSDNRGYGLPMSYRYDEENDRVVLGFVNAPGSKKQEFAEQTDEATLTVYEYEDVDSWESVVVTGALRRISESDVPDRFTSLFYLQEDDNTGDSRLVDIDEFEREWYELRIDDVAGRHSGWEPGE